MIVNRQDISNYLEDVQRGAIKQGLGLGIPAADDYFRWKKGNFNVIQGHDNVGKTYFRTWYYLVLSVKYGLKWVIWTGENQAGQIYRDLIQFLSRQYVKNMNLNEIYSYQAQIEQWFTFVDNSKAYTYEDLLKIFGDHECDGVLIDPYTGLKRGYGHSDNYDFLNKTREWVNKTGITLDLCTHPVSASGRANAIYPTGHIWEGAIRQPLKAEVEGGKPFANRCDDFFTVHRMHGLETMRNYTLIYVDKVKDTETGGQVSLKDSPVLLLWEKGLGFTIEGVNPLHDKYVPPVENYEPKQITQVNTNFDNEIDFNNNGEEVPF